MKLNIFLHFGLIALSLVLGLILTFVYGFWYAFPFYLIFIILLAIYFLFGTVQSAAELMQKQDFEAADQRLNLTFKPGWLYVANRAYYYIIKGTILMQQNQKKEAEECFKIAESLPLNSDDEKAMVQMQLAGLQIQKKNRNAAKKHLKEAKSLNITSAEIKGQLKQLEMALGQSTKMGMHGQMQQRGKRRRPKMR